MIICWISTIALAFLEFCVYPSVALSYISLDSAFRSYQELWPENFTAIVKRDTTTGNVRFKLVSFAAFDKFFVLHLTPGSPVLSEDFRVKTVDAKGKMSSFQIETSDFYSGYSNGNPSHAVDALNIDGIWIAQITAADDTYSIEPLIHYNPDSSAGSMVIYRVSDIRPTQPGHTAAHPSPFCQVVKLEPKSALTVRSGKRKKRNALRNSTISAPGIPQTGLRESTKRQQRLPQVKESGRSRQVESRNRNRKPTASREQFRSRSSESHVGRDFHKHDPHPSRPRRQHPETYDTCDVFAIADFEFYQGVGNKSLYRTTALLVHIYQFVDRIFRRTQFDDITNVGISLVGILVHTNYTESNTNHYNMANNRLSGMQTLLALADLDNLGSSCAAHLSTQRNFAGTLGLAATASAAPDWSNGICGRDNRDYQSRNMGLSTTVTSNGKVLPLVTYSLVVAHELGHNFGSQHDPETDDCSPAKGGKYIMWSYSGQAFGEHSYNFSPCSTQAIASVVKSKAHMCFKPKSVIEQICGNSILDPGEDCDQGYRNLDPCCTSECRFKEGAVCSPLNHVCCTNSCRTAPPTQLCFSTDDMWCYETPFCSGTSFQTCPRPKPLSDNSTCFNHGRCLNGRCVSLCELRGMSYSPPARMTECMVEVDRQVMCKHSCWDPSKSDHCDILDQQFVEGTPCLLGFCKNGTCESPKSDDFSFDDYPAPVDSQSVSPISFFCFWMILLTQVVGHLNTIIYASYS